MAYNLLTGRKTGRDLSLCISGEDDGSGSWWNPLSWGSSKEESKNVSNDETAVKEAKRAEREAAKKAHKAAVQLSLDKQAEALEKKAEAAKARAEKNKSSSIGVVYDELGRAQIIDI
jgi:hypothetical protein